MSNKDEASIIDGENTCDKSENIEKTEQLIWFSEDFKPLKGEKVNWKEIKKYDYQAVCETCYHTLLT